jgi:hypothetical protein
MFTFAQISGNGWCQPLVSKRKFSGGIPGSWSYQCRSSTFVRKSVMSDLQQF